MRETRSADRDGGSLTNRRVAGTRSTRLSSAVAAAIAAVALGPVSPAQAQQTDVPEETIQPDEEAPRTAERCATPEHRQFDFWLGRWEVRDPDGEVVGHNEIRRVAGGCGLLESWRGAGGGTGTSVNSYDADLGRWTQRWVGAGTSLWLEGGIEEGPEGRSMVLTGTEPRSTPRGPVLDRISWTPLPDGRVRQVWEISPDGGETWDESFVGLYSRLAPEEENGEPAPSARSAGSSLHFTHITSGAAVTDARSSPGASWVDIDGDGDEDLYVLNGFGSLEEEPRPQPNALYLNDGAGRFTRVREHPLVEDVTFSGSAVWGDYDNDGDRDLFVANQQGADNFLFRNDGDGAFVRRADGPPVSDGGRSFSAAWVDVDGDRLLDLHVLNGRDGDGGQADFFYRNLGDGGFERRTDLPFTRESLRSGGAAWADFDGDGDPDLLLPVHEAGQRPRLYRNEGDLRFTEITDEAGLAPDPLPFWPAASVAQWIDYDGDGDLDLFLGTTGGNADFLFANDGDGRFERVVAGRVGLDATYVSDALWADLDNDGDLDLLLAVWGGASEIYLNDGSGGLRPAEADGFGEFVTFASSATAADIDGDGDLDPYLTQWPINEAGGAPNLLYRNDGPAGDWLKIDLEGTESNRSAIGAQVTVTAEIGGERRRQLRHVTSRSSWRSANSPTQHFGLGDAGRADRIEVVWPSGRVDTLDGPIAANRRVRIVEGGDPPPGIVAQEAPRQRVSEAEIDAPQLFAVLVEDVHESAQWHMTIFVLEEVDG